MSEGFPKPTEVDLVFESSPEFFGKPSASTIERHFNWAWGLGILVVGIAAELFVWNVVGKDRTYQVIFSLPIVSGTPFFLMLWWVFFSGIDWSTRALGVGAVASVCGLFYSQYRFDGYEGDMIPRFTHRSEPTAEAKLVKFLKTQPDRQKAKASTAVASPIDASNDVANAAEPTALADLNSKPVSVEWSINTEHQWYQYRGPARDGVVREIPININWGTSPEEVWRHPVGAGWSSFSIVQVMPPGLTSDAHPRTQGYAFTQEQRGEQECVVAYEAETGNQIWAHGDDIRFEETLGGPGPRATPTVAGTLVYSLGATGQLNCLNALTGEKVWATNILTDAGAKNINWAMAGSPLVVGNMVIVNPGGEKGSGVIAYEKLSGKQLWAVGNDPASYTAPVLATLLGREQVIIFGGKGPVGHDPESGKELWRFAWENEPKVNAAIPILVDDSSIMIGCGYSVGSVLLRFSQAGDNWNVTSEWASKKLKMKFNAPVRKGNFAYGLDEGILTCVDLRSGNSEWKRGRYGYGQLLLCGDVLIVQAESGEVAFVSATPEKFVELHRFPALNGKSWNHPVVWNGHLFVRNGEEAACFDLRTQ
ncbi:MAG: PQQ-like beta-propeller repeat protein [Planctomycetota bacterium]|nr:PQQ-like beta-propeller repeat protein [Planctomycetota bacterium]